MKLLVDIGNSCVKWATLDKDGLSDSQYFQRGKSGIKTNLTKAWKAYSDIEAIYVANVAGEKIAAQLTEWCQKQWQLEPNFILAEQKKFGVNNAYEEAEKLGVDRWLSLISARQHARNAQCIIDCGTAITVDIVTRNGQHQGGMILPGLTLMRRSLASDTHALTEESGDQEFKTLATNTFSAIQVGTLYSVSAALNQLIDDLTLSFNKQIRFVITGGDATQLIPLLPDNVYHYPDIVLKGLAFYARQDNASNIDQDDSITEQVNDANETESNSEQSDANEISSSEKTDEEVLPESKPVRKPRRGRKKKPAANEEARELDDVPEEASVALPEESN